MAQVSQSNMAGTNTGRHASLMNPKENHDLQILAICAVFSFLSLASIIARLISRRIKRVDLKVDEALLIIAWVFASAQAVMFAYGTKHVHLGWHVMKTNYAELVALQKAYYAAYFLQTTALALAKLSILLLLRRIFFVTRAFRITTSILGAIVLLWWIANSCGSALVCFPQGGLWKPNLKAPCADQRLLNIVSPIPWVLTDFAILICPIPVIKNLQLPRGKRVGLYAVFLLGGLTCLVSVIRYRTLFYPLNDLTWDIVPLAIWNVIESHVTIICATIIACKPVFTFLLSLPPFSHIRSRLRKQQPFSKDLKIFYSFGLKKGLSRSSHPRHENSTASLSKTPPTPNTVAAMSEIGMERSLNSVQAEVV